MSIDHLDQPIASRLYYVVTHISAPFNGGLTVEIKLEADRRTSPYESECYIRVPVREAKRFTVGDTYTWHPTRIE